LNTENRFDNTLLKFDSFMRNKVNPYMPKGSQDYTISVPTPIQHTKLSYSVSVGFDARYGAQRQATVGEKVSAAITTSAIASPALSITSSISSPEENSNLYVEGGFLGHSFGRSQKGFRYSFSTDVTPGAEIGYEIYSREFFGVYNK
jgi:hypothetical protein